MTVKLKVLKRLHEVLTAASACGLLDDLQEYVPDPDMLNDVCDGVYSLLTESRTAIQSSGVTADRGLLWVNGKSLDAPEADAVARHHGFAFAEDLVKFLSENPVF
jgi:hypothetical protein